MLSPHLVRMLRLQAAGLSPPHLCPLKSKLRTALGWQIGCDFVFRKGPEWRGKALAPCSGVRASREASPRPGFGDGSSAVGRAERLSNTSHARWTVTGSGSESASLLRKESVSNGLAGSVLGLCWSEGRQHVALSFLLHRVAVQRGKESICCRNSQSGGRK